MPGSKESCRQSSLEVLQTDREGSYPQSLVLSSGMMVPGWPNSVIDVDVLEISRISRFAGSRLQKNVPEKQLRKPAATDGTYLNIGDSRFGGLLEGQIYNPLMW